VQQAGGLPTLGKTADLPPLGLVKLGQIPPAPAPLSRREPLTAEDIASHPNIAQLSADMDKEREQLAVRSGLFYRSSCLFTVRYYVWVLASAVRSAV
jgi:hypothetical protein